MAFVRIADIRVDRQFEARLPLPGNGEFAALVEDIRKHGVLVDLIITEDGLLLDGHRRLRAAKVAGIESVPVRKLSISGEVGWEKAIAITLNLTRRNLSEAQRAILGSSLLRIERAKAKERQLAGQARGRAHRSQEKFVQDDGHPEPKDELRATAQAAEAIGVSRQTFERVELIKRSSPETLRRVLAGEVSITAAYREVRARCACQRVEQSLRDSPGHIERLEDAFGRYRTVYLGSSLSAHAPALNESIVDLPLQKLSHNEGCRFWVRVSWAVIRKRVIHRLLDSWKLRWIGELQLLAQPAPRERCLRRSSEILLLATCGSLPAPEACLDSLENEADAGELNPNVFHKLIGKVSPAPRLELFSHVAHDAWDHWQGDSVRMPEGAGGN